MHQLAVYSSLIVNLKSHSDHLSGTLIMFLLFYGQEAKIYCSHSESNYDQILWYKQSEGQMLLLGYVYFRDTHPEAGLGVKLGGGASKDQNCTLTVEDVNSSSSAVYFCAARSHSDACG
uniref:Ig-like domain-containing protein n=1 Tax=Oryzias latipes TaxID=8090 RepID=A0A3P9K0D9_ORYLA